MYDISTRVSKSIGPALRTIWDHLLHSLLRRRYVYQHFSVLVSLSTEVY